MRQQCHWRKAAFITVLQQASPARRKRARSQSQQTITGKKHFDRTTRATWLLGIAEQLHFYCPMHQGSANEHGAAETQAGCRPMSC